MYNNWKGFDVVMTNPAIKAQYLQLADALADKIKSGDLPKGSRLPSVRKYALEVGVSHITANKVFVKLEEYKLIERVHGSGSFVIYKQPFSSNQRITEAYVSDQFKLLKSKKQTRSLLVALLKNTSHICPYNFSYALISPALIENTVPNLSDIFRDVSINHVYGDMRGDLSLREELKDYYAFGGNVENALITSGNQHGINLIANLLVDEGDNIFIENPTYTGAVDVFTNKRANLIGWNFHEAGSDFYELEQKIIALKPKLFFLTPNYSNPSGYVLDNEERTELLRLSIKHNFCIIEDDHWSEISFDNEVQTLISMSENTNNVIGLRGFSKIIGPESRIGVMFANKSIIEGVEKQLIINSLGVSQISQAYLLKLIKSGHYKRLSQVIKNDLRERRNIVNKALLPLRAYGVRYEIPSGGINYWIELPDGMDSEKLLFDKMFKEGITFLPGSLCGVNSVDEFKNCLRFNYSFLPISSLKVGLKKFVCLLTEELEK